MSTANNYIEFCIQFIEDIKRISKEYDIKSEWYHIVPKSSLFKRNKDEYRKVYYPELLSQEALLGSALSDYYNEIELYLISKKLHLQDFKIVSDFIDFILFAEKCFMYRNSEESKVYAEILDNKKILYLKFDDYKVRFTKEVTKIKNPLSSNIALSMILGDEDSNINISTIEIKRIFGKEVTNTFKFISGENIELEREEELLLNVVYEDISKLLSDTFDSIVQSSIERSLDIKTIKWKDVKKDGGLWIRRHSS